MPKAFSKKLGKILGMLSLVSMLLLDIGFFIFRLIQGAPLAFLIVFPVLILFEMLLFIGLMPGAIEYGYFDAMWPYFLAFGLPCFANLAFGLILHSGFFGVFFVALALRTLTYLLFVAVGLFARLPQKKIMLFILFLMVGSVLIAAPVFSAAHDPDISFQLKWPLTRSLRYEYTENKDGVIVAGVYDGIGGSVVIPESYNGLPVVSINSGAFLGENSIKNVSVAASVRNIGTKAFLNCKNLNSIEIDGESEFGDDVFLGCENLKQVRLKASKICKFKNNPFEAGGKMEIIVDRNLIDNYRQLLVLNQNRMNFAPQIDSDETYIHFETESEYLATKIVKRGQVLDLDLLDNTSIKFSQDTAQGAQQNYSYAGIRNGYTLSGWYTDKQYSTAKVDFYNGFKIDEEMILFAKWLKVYSASFKMNYSATNPKPILYTEESFVELSKPQRKGYKFCGWDDSSSTKVEVIDIGTKKDLTLWADWELDKPSVALKTNKTNNSMTYRFDDGITIKAEASHILPEVSFSYQWYYKGNEIKGAFSDTIFVKNVHESGEYSCMVKATDGTYNTKSELEQAIAVQVLSQELSVNWLGNKQITFDAEEHKITANVVGADDLQNLNAKTSITYRKNSNQIYSVRDVGAYTATVTLAAQETNYHLPSETTFSYTIVPREINIQWGVQTEFVYNAQAQGPSIADYIDLEGDRLDISCTSAIAAGNYEAQATAQNGNYLITNSTKSFQIKKAPITLSADDITQQYGLSPVKPTYSIDSGTKFGSDFLSVGLVKASGSDVGTYSISISAENPNYDYTLIKGTYTITKAPITIKAEDKSSVYGAVLEPLNYTTTGTLYGTDAAGVTLEKETGNTVGTYDIAVSFDNPNYDITLQNGTYTIEKASLTIKADDKSSVYGAALEQLTYTTTGKLYGADAAGVTLEKEAGQDARVYDIAVSFDNPNYEITLLSGAYTITKAPITIRAENKTSVYGAALEQLTYTTTGTLYGTDAAGVTLEKETGNNAGTYDITASFSNPNYEITLLSGEYKITKAPYTVSAENKTSVYGATLEPLTYTTAGTRVGDDNLNIELIKDVGNSVGAYTIAVSASNPNYEFTLQSGTYTITKAQITIMAQNKSSVYGATFAELTYTITSGTLYGTDATGIALEKEAGNAVDTYDIMVLFDNPNYDITLQSGTYTITKAQITIVVDSKSTVYGAVLEELTYTALGALYGTDERDIILEKQDGLNAGTYSITASFDNPNYEVTVYNGTYTIEQAPISIITESKSSVYGAAIKELTYTLIGTLYGNDADGIILEKEEGVAVREYYITGYFSNPNYSITISSSTYTITPAPITIKAENKTSVYGADFVELTYTIIGTRFYDDDLNIMLAKDSGNTVGTYNIAISASNLNYDFTLTDGTYTITKAQITITAENKTSVYGADFAELTYTIIGALYGTDADGVTLDKELGITVGTYDIYVHFDDSNYEITLQNGEYTITKASVTLKAEDKWQIEGESEETLTYQVTEGEIFGSDANDLTVLREPGSQPGEYTITIVFDNDNYDAVIIDAVYTIVQ